MGWQRVMKWHCCYDMRGERQRTSGQGSAAVTPTDPHNHLCIFYDSSTSTEIPLLAPEPWRPMRGKAGFSWFRSKKRKLWKLSERKSCIYHSNAPCAAEETRWKTQTPLSLSYQLRPLLPEARSGAFDAAPGPPPPPRSSGAPVSLCLQELQRPAYTQNTSVLFLVSFSYNSATRWPSATSPQCGQPCCLGLRP
jgi:hypothetical protein